MTHVAINGINGMRLGQIESEVESGARFVIFQYCFSVVFMTFRRSSDIYFVRPGETAWTKSLKWTTITCFLGWWGIPWGFIYTPSIIMNNLKGGKDVTAAVIEHFYSDDEEFVDASETADAL